MSEIMVSEKPKGKKGLPPIIRHIIRKTMIYIISFGIVFAMFYTAVNEINRLLFEPMDTKDETEITVEIPMGTSVRGIAEILYNNGLIRNKGVFRMFIELSDKASKLKAGRYVLSKNMDRSKYWMNLLQGRLR